DQARERHRFFPLEEYDLDTLCRRFDIRPGDRHTAWGDAMLTAQLFLKLLKIKEKEGKGVLRDLL
ncbi:MAG: hypothetical protein EAZ89_21065, partial [Bacteroidetes bacterium]